MPIRLPIAPKIIEEKENKEVPHKEGIYPPTIEPMIRPSMTALLGDMGSIISNQAESARSPGVFVLVLIFIRSPEKSLRVRILGVL